MMCGSQATRTACVHQDSMVASLPSLADPLGYDGTRWYCDCIR